MSRAITYFKLGLKNLARVYLYRISIKIPFSAIRRLKHSPVYGCFFDQPVYPTVPDCIHGNFYGITYFGWKQFSTSNEIPKWHKNLFNGKNLTISNQHWWFINDFNAGVGDIKTIWEASRFDWVFSFSRAAATGDKEAIKLLNTWLDDWCKNNQFYMGPNWKCGQEASFRVLHLSMAALLLGVADSARRELIELINAHLARIFPTVSYAIAQDNNHGTSEAAALFIGGSLLVMNGMKNGALYETKGHWLLENRAKRLIGSDGSFSQYSVNYHRLMLDTFSFVELWIQRFDLVQLSDRTLAQLRLASTWLYYFVNPIDGCTPNIGGNDGAKLFPVAEEDYSDYRSSVQLSMYLFNKAKAYTGDGSWNTLTELFGLVQNYKQLDVPSSRLFDFGGYAFLASGNARVYMRYPRYRFRPSHSDALHLDFWLNGQNEVRDAGSYSYNAGEELQQYFPGTEAHSTIQMDGRDQMPRYSRFLYGEWLKSRDIYFSDTDELLFKAQYSDWKGAQHKRSVRLEPSTMKVEDSISGFQKKAILRWRLKNDAWTLYENTLSCKSMTIAFDATMPIERTELVTGLESRYYLRKDTIPVLEIEVTQPGTINSTFKW